MNSRVVITLPLPNPKLHAHAKGDWRGKVKPTRDLRSLACLLTKQEAPGVSWPAAAVSYRFWFPDLIRRDAANAIQSMKAAIDGVKDSGLIPDDDWRHLSIGGVVCGVDRESPRTELIFSRIAEMK